MIIKLNSSNGSILWEKPIGSAGNDTLFGFEVDSFGTIMVGVGLTVPFSLNGNLISEGSDFLFKLDSVQGSPSFAPVVNRVTPLNSSIVFFTFPFDTVTPPRN